MSPWVSVVALVACLVLALSAYGSHRLGAGRTLVLGLAWIAIFLLVAGVFTAVGQ